RGGPSPAGGRQRRPCRRRRPRRAADGLGGANRAVRPWRGPAARHSCGAIAGRKDAVGPPTSHQRSAEMKRWLMRAALLGLLAAVVPSPPAAQETPPPVNVLPETPAAPLPPPGSIDHGCAAPHGRTVSVPQIKLVPHEHETAIPKWIVKELVQPAYVLTPEIT